ncbi:MAG: DUF1571 domain-containing protein [Bacteroidota bacterium]
MKSGWITYIIIASVVQVRAQAVEPIDPHSIIQASIQQSRAVNSAAYTLENTERIDGKWLSGTQEIRYRNQPLQVCMNFVHPAPGTMVTFDEIVDPERLVYDPAGFPFMKIDLDPMGSMARNSNHHTIYETGFDHFAELIATMYDQHEAMSLKENPHSSAYRLQLIASDQTTEYVVNADESTRSLAKRIGVSEYRIVELNEKVKGYGELKEGLTLRLPIAYAHELIVEIDKRTLLPTTLTLNDELGMLAYYSIRDIELGVEVVTREMGKKARYFEADE